MSPYRDPNKGQSPYENLVASPQRGPYMHTGGQDPRGFSETEPARQPSRRIISNLEHRATSPTPRGFSEVNEGGTPHPHSSPVHVAPEVPQVQYHHTYALTQSRPSKYQPNPSNRPTSPTNLPTTDSLSDTDLDQLPRRTGKGSPHPARERSRSKSSPSQRMKNRSETRLFSIKKRNKSKKEKTAAAATGSELTETQRRRISSPEGMYTPQLMQKYFPSSEDSPDDQVMVSLLPKLWNLGLTPRPSPHARKR